MTITQQPTTTHPVLDDRARGWLNFIWEKSTTPDDWSSAGEPLPWWDQTSTPPMCSLGRFDLHETGYVLPVMCDMTPAWREVYTRIADELVGRYTTFWSAIDWLSMIGHDPGADKYPSMWHAYLPEYLRGGYDAPGWPANGVAPWGLQPDPIGADGSNFFRGFFNLLLCFYEYVSGDDKWAAPFKVTGYQDRIFHWDHHSIVNFMVDQWAERPAGVHWIICDGQEFTDWRTGEGDAIEISTDIAAHTFVVSTGYHGGATARIRGVAAGVTATTTYQADSGCKASSC